MHELAGKPAPRELLTNIPLLVASYYSLRPDPSAAGHRVSFGTSGHRGSSLDHSFNEDHILAICQAIAGHRIAAGIDGPLFLGKDTHALSEPAWITAVEVLAANGIEIVVQEGRGFTPTPVISRAILRHNEGRKSGLSDGVIITPSHNPPRDGGIKYNPPSGGPAGAEITRGIQDSANRILEGGLEGVRRITLEQALRAATTHHHDFIGPYVRELADVVDMKAIRDAGIRMGVDPMGGAGVHFWGPIADVYGVSLEVVNPNVDPSFSFMTVDHDGKIRMDCSSPYAMAGLIKLRERFDIAFGNDPDYDRHGVVTRQGGLMNPNHYLSVAVDYLFRHRPGWGAEAAIGKTLVSSSMIDRVAGGLNRRLVEVPVGFKWFVEGLLRGELAFGGEESAGASFLRKDGRVWTTDKDGFILNLLAAEITAVTGRDPSMIYGELETRHGSPVYERIDSPATRDQKAVLGDLSPESVRTGELGGEPILAKLTRAPGNDAPIGGLKVVAENGWFAARPSGTEDVYKIYAESFLGAGHLKRIQDEAREIVNTAMEDAGS